MSIFRGKHQSANVRPKGNRRVSDGKSEKAAPQRQIPHDRKNRRTPDDIPVGKRDGNRRVLRKKNTVSEETELKKKRINRRRPKVEATPPEPLEVDDVDNEPPERKRFNWKPYVFGLGRLLAVLVTIALVVWGAGAAYRYALTSTYFALQHVEINGNERLTNSDVLAAAGIEMEQNIFSVNLAEVAKRLEDTPWVVSAGVRQKLPKTIIIDIIERKSTMMVLFDVPYLVDESGEIFKRWTTGDPMPQCMLSGLGRRDLIEDQEGTQQIILDAISLRDRYNSAGNKRYADLYEIHREIDGGFSLTVGKKPFYIKLGKPPYRKKLNRMAQLFGKMGKNGRQPLIVYFDNEKRPDRVTVKYKPQEAKRAFDAQRR
ncbi:MAG: FtsQ-type POTRA domain-containing protein [Deltaproteobacteria bacterium]|nr:FtsQ-type POTRA domain-containing protein [Deltaproteobacteria bacterium]